MLLSLLLSCGLREDVPDLVRLREHADGLLFSDVQLFDATSTAATPHTDVLVRGGRVAAVGPTGTLQAGAADVIAGEGMTLMPALIDMHVHVLGAEAPPWDLFLVSGEDHLQAWLAAGVTTVLDMGSDPKPLAALRDGAAVGPRIYMAGSSPVTVSGGHPIVALQEILPGPMGAVVSRKVLTVDEPSEAAGVVAEMLPHSPDHVKVIYDRIPDASNQMSPASLRAIVEAAHGHGLPVSVHIGTPQDLRDAIGAGADLLAHGVYQGALSAEDAALAAQAGVPVVATAWAFEATARTGEGTLAAAPLDVALAPERARVAAVGAAGTQILDYPTTGEMARTCADSRAARRENVRLLHEAGAVVLAGSDSPFFGIWAGASLHHELEELVRAGLSPAEALRSATALPAAYLEQAPDFGTVEVGKVADLLLVRGDPLADISATQDIEMVLQAGVEVVRLPTASR